MSDEAGDPELRRRAAWLLGMLVLVAVAVVALLVTLLHTPATKKTTQTVIGPDDSLSPSTGNPSVSTSADHSSSSSVTASSSASSSSGSPTSSLPPSCDSTCVVHGDVGATIAAVNAYRMAHGRKEVDGSITGQAQKCAMSDGSTCPLEFSETSLGKPSGTAAAKKLGSRVGLLDADMRSFEVGWAYNPRAKTYYVALIKVS